MIEDEEEIADANYKDVSVRCVQCRSKLELGEDLFTVESGVLGPRGVVPLEAAQVFCSSACVVKHFEETDENGPVQLRRRVP